jgi:Tol biopolymer transport system component
VLGAVAFLVGGAAAPAAETKITIVGDDSPAWSPDGQWIAFTSFRTPRSDIWVMRPDGSDQHALTHDVAYDDQATWSPDGKQIAFTSDKGGTLEVWLMNADGSNQRRLTSGNGTNFDPSWSRDARRIAFRSNRDGESQIYTMRTDGSDVLRLTHDFAASYSPSWGPDGRILFISSAGITGKATVQVMNGDGSDQHPFAPAASTGNAASPIWSPDGKRVVFQTDADGPVANTELYVVNSDGTGLRRLTTYPAGDRLPAWSPDGQRIAFARGPDQFRNEVYVMNADGSNTRELILSKLVGVDIGIVPNRPKSGHVFAIAYDVEPRSGADLGFSPTVTCSARVAGQRLQRRSIAFDADFGRAACVWQLPSAARGKFVRGTIAVHGPTGTISERFSFRAR